MTTNRFLIFLQLKWQELCSFIKEWYSICLVAICIFTLLLFADWGPKSDIPIVVFLGNLFFSIVLFLSGLLFLLIILAVFMGIFDFLKNNWQEAGRIAEQRKSESDN